MAQTKSKRRLDKDRIALRPGESQRKNGGYDYRWKDEDGIRRSIYARSLDELREKEEQLVVDRHDGIKYDAKRLTINDVFDMWCELKQQSVAYANLRQNLRQYATLYAKMTMKYMVIYRHKWRKKRSKTRVNSVLDQQTGEQPSMCPISPQ